MTGILKEVLEVSRRSVVYVPVARPPDTLAKNLLGGCSSIIVGLDDASWVLELLEEVFSHSASNLCPPADDPGLLYAVLVLVLPPHPMRPHRA